MASEQPSVETYKGSIAEGSAVFEDAALVKRPHDHSAGNGRENRDGGVA